jgi:hypothetical protein
MPFQTQFALSLELSRLIPMSLAIAGQTYEAALKLARELQVCSWCSLIPAPSYLLLTVVWIRHRCRRGFGRDIWAITNRRYRCLLIQDFGIEVRER